MDSGSPKTNPAGIVGNIRKLYAYIIVVCVTIALVIWDVNFRDYLKMKNDIEVICAIRALWDTGCLDKAYEVSLIGSDDGETGSESACGQYFELSVVSDEELKNFGYVSYDREWTMVSPSNINRFNVLPCMLHRGIAYPYRCQLSIECFNNLAEFKQFWNGLAEVEIIYSNESLESFDNLVMRDIEAGYIIYNFNLKNEVADSMMEVKINEISNEPESGFVNVQLLPGLHNINECCDRGVFEYLTLEDISEWKDRNYQYAFQDPIIPGSERYPGKPKYYIMVDSIQPTIKNLQEQFLEFYEPNITNRVNWKDGDYDEVFVELRRNLEGCEYEDVDFVRGHLEVLSGAKVGSIDIFGIKINNISIAYTGAILLVLLSFLMLIEFAQLEKSIGIKSDIGSIAWFPFYRQVFTSILHGLALSIPPLVVLMITVRVNTLNYDKDNVIFNCIIIAILTWIACRQIILDGKIKSKIREITKKQKFYNSQ